MTSDWLQFTNLEVTAEMEQTGMHKRYGLIQYKTQITEQRQSGGTQTQSSMILCQLVSRILSGQLF